MLRILDTIDISAMIDVNTRNFLVNRIDTLGIYLNKLYCANKYSFNLYILLNLYDIDIKKKFDIGSRFERVNMFKSQLSKYWYHRLVRDEKYIYIIPAYVSKDKNSVIYKYENKDILIENLAPSQLQHIGSNRSSAHIRVDSETNHIYLDLCEIPRDKDKFITIGFTNNNDKNIIVNFYSKLEHVATETFSLKLKANNLSKFDEIITNYIIPFGPDSIMVQRLVPQDFFDYGYLAEKSAMYYSGELNCINVTGLDAFISMIYSICLSEGIVNRMTASTRIYGYCPNCCRHEKTKNGQLKFVPKSSSVVARFNSSDTIIQCKKCGAEWDLYHNLKTILEKCALVETPKHVKFEERI